MKLKILSLFTLIILLSMTKSLAQRPHFDKSKDILIAAYDIKPDPDDIHAAAALGSMLAHPDLDGVNYFAVAGAYGGQGGSYLESNSLFNMAFGNNWADAHNNRSAAITAITNKVVPILQNGGKVWVQEGGQSDVTADWLMPMINASNGINSALTKTNVVVVQHDDGFNEGQANQTKLNNVKANTYYFLLDDGNAGWNDAWGDHGPWSTPMYRDRSNTFVDNAKTSPNTVAKNLWTEADRIFNAYFPNGFPHDWSFFYTDGVDYSDCVENWWIFEIGTNADTHAKFWNRYVMNTPQNAINVTGVSVTPASTSIEAGSSAALSANVSPSNASNKNVNWTSSNTNVASVNSSGVVSGISAGTATITATTQDGGFTDTSAITITPSTGGNGAWQESGGYLVVDTESLDFPAGSLWSKHTTGGNDPWGNGYIQYDGPDRQFVDPLPDGVLKYNIKISTPGTYQLIWRTGYGFNSTTFDGANDSWLKINGSDFYGMKGGVKTSSVDHFMKVWVQKDAFVNECNGEHAGVNNLTIFADFDSPGYYSIEVAGRSQGHVIDRLFLFQDGKGTLAMANNGPESLREGGSNPIPVTGVNVSPASASVAAGSTTPLSASVTPNNATNKSVSWSSSNNNIATVNGSGVVTGVAAGSATITATTADGGFTDTSSITVTPSTGGSTVNLSATQDAYLQGAGGTLINNADLRVESGNRVSYLMFDLSGVSGNITAASLKLSVSSDSGNGTINVHEGNSNNWTEANLSNSNKPAQGALLGSLNTTYALTQSYTWTLDAAEISGGGNLSLIVSAAGGNDVSFGSDENGNASYKPVLTITTSGDTQPIPVTGVTVSPSTSSLEVGQTAVLNETVAPANADDKSVAWSTSNAAVATVSNTGLVTAVAAGSATITVTTTDGGFTAACSVTVTVPPTGQGPYGGTNRTLPGTIEAEDYDTGGQGVAYNDTDTGNNGNQYRTDDVDIEARDGGFNVGWGAAGEWLEYTVHATAGTYNIEARMAATTNGKSMVVKLDGATLGTINVPNTGDWGTFQTVSIDNIAVSGGNDKVLRLELVGGGMNLNWVKFSSAGPTPVPVTGVTISSAAETLDIGQTVDLNETVAPANADDKSVAWSTSDAGVATVSNSGLVTAVAAGSATITVTTNDGGFTATSAITVNTPPTGNDFTLGNGSDTNAGVDGWNSNMLVNETDTYTNNSGSSQSITINEFSFYANKEADPVTPFVVKVNSDNNFTVLAVGTSRTSAAYNVGQNTLAFNDGSAKVINVANGETIATGFLDANADGSGGNLGSVIAWESNAPADQIWYTGGAASGNSGSVTEGSAPTSGASTITTLTRNYHFNISFTAGASSVINVTGVSISSASETLEIGQTVDLNETVSPVNADDKSVSWSTSNPVIATVSNSGLVTAVAAGSASITVTTNDGGFTASSSITVNAPPVSNNLLSNPGFEMGDLTSYGSWGGVSVVVNNQRSGSYAVTVNGAGAPSQVVNVSPNTTYTFSLWGKVASAGQSVNVGVKGHDAAETVTQLTSTSYTKVSHTFTTGANATTAQVYFYVPGANTQAWGDDFELVEGNSAARRIHSFDPNEDNSLLNVISVYPNPLYNNELKISLASDQDSYVRIFDINGQLIYQKANTRDQLVVSQNEFTSKGMYFIHVQSGTINKRLKLIVR
ncbi:MAG: Ig-like domain-containing protein [Reichenbachiella sp.]